MSQANDSTRRFTAAVLIAAAAILVVSLLHADRAGRSGDVVLSALAPAIETLLAGGGELSRRGAELVAWLRLPALALIAAGLAAGLALRYRRRREIGNPTAQRVAALGLGCIAQSYLLEGSLGIGAALYAAAGGVYLWSGQSSSEPSHTEATAEPASRGELVGFLAIFALFVTACLYGLDVFPELYLDEIAFTNAARMHLGEIEPGWILPPPWHEVYTLERFQAQAIPFNLQAAAVSVFSPGVLPLRLVSVVAGCLGLVVAYLSLRPRLGRAAALWTVGLCCASPLYLAYSRAGLMIGVSMLQGVLTFAALLRLWDRWDRTSAVVLGVLLGSSLYSYQLSWFIPVLTLAAALAAPELWRRRGAVEIAAVTAAVAAAIAAPGWLLMHSGFRAVSEQTFDRAVWQRVGNSETAETALAVAITAPISNAEHLPSFTSPGVSARYLPGSKGSTSQSLFRNLQEIRDHYAEFEAHPEQVLVTPLSSEAGHTLLRLFGNRHGVEAALDELRGDRWDVLFDSTTPTTPMKNLSGMLAQLFALRDWESDGRLVDGPLLNPVLAPLLVLGLLAALRRRREPLMRMLCVWVLAGALLPAVIGGVVPRRSVLMLPLAYALVSLAMLEIAAGVLPRGLRRRRWVSVLASAVFLVAAAGVGSGLYFDRWDIRLEPWPPPTTAAAWGISPDRRSRLRLTKTLKSLPRDEVILMPRLFDRFMPYLEAVEEEPAPAARKHILEHPGADTPEQIHRISCRQPTPFTWVGFDTSQHRTLFRTIEEDFVHRAGINGAYRLLRIASPKPGRCP